MPSRALARKLLTVKRFGSSTTNETTFGIETPTLTIACKELSRPVSFVARLGLSLEILTKTSKLGKRTILATPLVITLEACDVARLDYLQIVAINVFECSTKFQLHQLPVALASKLLTVNFSVLSATNDTNVTDKLRTRP